MSKQKADHLTVVAEDAEYRAKRDELKKSGTKQVVFSISRAQRRAGPSHLARSAGA
jgi:hypothetical protein